MRVDMRAIMASYALVGGGPEMGRSSHLGHSGYLPHGFIIMMPEVQCVGGSQHRDLREQTIRIW